MFNDWKKKYGRGQSMVHALTAFRIMEPTTVGSLWLENDLHENELEFESYMGRSKKNVRVTSDGIHAEIHEIWTCVAPAAPPLCHAAVNPCLQFSQSDIRAIISAPYLFGVVTFVLFAVATPNKYGDLLFESRVTSRRLRESEFSWRALKLVVQQRKFT